MFIYIDTVMTMIVKSEWDLAGYYFETFFMNSILFFMGYFENQ